jgi:CxxC motif-containing protein (DUF1111 family)
MQFAIIAASASLCTFAGIPAFADPSLPGGATTTQFQDVNAFSQPASNLDLEARMNFSIGNSFFRNPWIAAPATTTARDGLGPLFNTNSCQGCHIKDGRGHPPLPGQTQAVSTLIRLSIPETVSTPRAASDGVVSEPTYGDQLQDFSVAGVEPEARIQWEYEYSNFEMANGSVVELRKPIIELTHLAYGPMHPDLMISPRVAPAMIGLGLLETIPSEDILANADPEDANQDGISGRPNTVWDRIDQELVLGRFGWKASKPTVEQQSAAAFFGDIGITSTLSPPESCMPAQTSCLEAPDGVYPEISNELLGLVSFYSRHLAVPARPDAAEPEVVAGEQIFTEVGCAGCHKPNWQTGAGNNPALSNQSIYPYTDLLLHDMGEGLADNRPDFDATGQEWRTPPLWGLGSYQVVNGHTQFLHDGRARNALEAILWHDGEAAAAKNEVAQLSEDKLNSLLLFLDSL